MILFLDEYVGAIRPFMQEFNEAGIETTAFTNPDGALVYLEQHLESVQLIVTEVVLPTGTRLDVPAAHEGLKAGMVLYEYLRCHGYKGPIVFLTTQPIEPYSNTRIRCDRKCFVYDKMHVIPSRFAKVFAGYFASQATDPDPAPAPQS